MIDMKIADELKQIFYEVCLASDKMAACISPAIEILHNKFKDDDRELKMAILETCLSVISNNEIDEWIDRMDQVIEKESEEVHEAIKKYKVTDDLWNVLKKEASDTEFNRVVFSFYSEHVATAQRMLLSAWKAKLAGDPAYQYKGLEKD